MVFVLGDDGKVALIEYYIVLIFDSLISLSQYRKCDCFTLSKCEQTVCFLALPQLMVFRVLMHWWLVMAFRFAHAVPLIKCNFQMQFALSQIKWPMHVA